MNAVDKVQSKVLNILNSKIWSPCRSGESPIENFIVIGPASPETIDEGIRQGINRFSLKPVFPCPNDMSKVEYVKNDEKPELKLITIEADDVMNEALTSSLPYNGEGVIRIESDSNPEVMKAENELGYGILYIRNVTANSHFPTNFLYNLSMHHMYYRKVISSKWLIVLGFSDKCADLTDVRMDYGIYVNMNEVE